VKALQAKDIARLLTFREFLRLCQFFDAKKRSASEYDRCGTSKFDVFGVIRDGEKLIVSCRGEDGELINLDCSPQKKAA
jgi:hypothetical protein